MTKTNVLNTKVSIKGIIFSRFNRTYIIFQKPMHESILLISGSSMFHSFIIYGKKNFWRFLYYTELNEKNIGFIEIFVMEVTNLRDRKVALMIWSCINRNVFSYIVYLFKIQNLTLHTFFLWISL